MTGSGCLGCLNFGRQRKQFLEAAKQGNEDQAQQSLTDKPDLVRSTTFLKKKTALHLAAEAGHLTVLSSILETLICTASQDAGNDVMGTKTQSFISEILNFQDSKGQTPLLIASQGGHVDCARYLMANGADRTVQDHKGNTALHYACSRGYLGLMFMLLSEFNQDGQQDLERLVDIRNTAGFTPLHFAVWGKQSAAVQVLLQHGAEVTAKNTRAASDMIPCPVGSTPLHLACARGHIEISRIILKTYAERILEPLQLGQATSPRSIAALDPRTQVNGNGHMPYQVAQRLGFFTLAMLLRPNIPIVRLFSEEERNVRFYGPPPLKAIAAEALNKKLIASLENLAANASAANASTQNDQEEQHGTSSLSSSEGQPVSRSASMLTATDRARSNAGSRLPPNLQLPAIRDTLPSAGGNDNTSGSSTDAEPPQAPLTPGAEPPPLEDRTSNQDGASAAQDEQHASTPMSLEVVMSPSYSPMALQPPSTPGCPSSHGQTSGISSSNPSVVPLLLHSTSANFSNGADGGPLSPSLLSPLTAANLMDPQPAAAVVDAMGSVTLVSLPGQPCSSTIDDNNSGNTPGLQVAVPPQPSSPSTSGMHPPTPDCSDPVVPREGPAARPSSASIATRSSLLATPTRSRPRSRPASARLPRANSSSTGRPFQLPCTCTPGQPCTCGAAVAEEPHECPPAVNIAVQGGSVIVTSSRSQPASRRPSRSMSTSGASGRPVDLAALAQGMVEDTQLVISHHSQQGVNCIRFDTAAVAPEPPMPCLQEEGSSDQQQAQEDAAGSKDESAVEAFTSLCDNPLFGDEKDGQPGACSEAEEEEEEEEGDEGDESSDDDECGVCLENPARVMVKPCKHVMCGTCAQKMCSMNLSKPSYCPFCRVLIADFIESTR